MKEDILNFIKYQLKEHCGRTVGVVIGFVIAVSVLLIGFFSTLFIIICVGAGLFVGNKIDKGDSEFLDNVIYRLQRLLPPFSRRW